MACSEIDLVHAQIVAIRQPETPFLAIMAGQTECHLFKVSRRLRAFRPMRSEVRL
jgi:hypothetical protein